MYEKIQEIWDFLNNSQNPFGVVAMRCLQVVGIIIGTFILIKLLHWVCNRLMKRKTKTKTNKRLNTIRKHVNSIITYTVTLFAFVQLLQSVFNVNLASILAAAGVVGVAVGFGAQSLVKDVIAGFFILLEGQFSVGDRITVLGTTAISAFTGTVDELGLRSTRIRDDKGDVFVIPNGTIVCLTNHSLVPNSFFVSCILPSETNASAILSLYDEVGKKAAADLSPLTQIPVPSISLPTEGDGISVRLKIICDPESKSLMERELVYRLEKALREAAIELPEEGLTIICE